MNQPYELRDDLGPLGDALRTIDASLNDGGPDVDAALLLDFVEKTLSPAEMEEVQRLTRTWRNWFWARLHLDALVRETDGNEATNTIARPELSTERKDFTARLSSISQINNGPEDTVKE